MVEDLVDVENLRMMHNDVALIKEDINDVSGGLIQVKEDEEAKQMHFLVVNKSLTVTDVCIGDRVVVPWTRITDPVMMGYQGEKKMVGITDAKEILAVLEDVDDE